MTDKTRYPLHTERKDSVEKWTRIGWTDCGEHPSLPGFHVLEWQKSEDPVAPFKSFSHETIDDEEIRLVRAAVASLEAVA